MTDRHTFWQGKRVFLTGHTGFKGSWLSLWLQMLGADLTGYALAPPTQPNLFTLARLAGGMESVTADIRDRATLTEVMQAQQPEIIFHLAAQPLVRQSYREPIETLATNVLGSAHLLDAVRQTPGVRVVVMITSDKCYENREWLWGYRETDALGGHDPYSASKAAAELVIASYRRSFFGSGETAVASTRAGNVIGGGDWAADRLVPDIMQAVMRGEPVVIRNPQATRPWQHVLEPLHGYLTLAEKLWQDGPALAEAWNFGPNDDDVKPVAWLVDYITHRWGSGASWRHDQTEQPHENTLLKLDCAKAKSRLHWQPRLDLATALDWIVAWFQGYQRGDDVRALTADQIKQFAQMHQGPA